MSAPPVGLRQTLRGREARRAWDHLVPGFRARGYPPDAAGWWALFALCREWALYRRLERLIATWPRSRALRRAVTEDRHRLRALCAECSLMLRARVPLAPLNARGEDTELARIFGRARGTRRRVTAGSTNNPPACQAWPCRGCDDPFFYQEDWH